MAPEEHGQKIKESAKNITNHLKNLHMKFSEQYKNLWKQLNILLEKKVKNIKKLSKNDRNYI